MTVRTLTIAAAILVALAAGAWAGAAANPERPHRSPALRTLDARRIEVRAQLHAATTQPAQSAAARRLAALHRAAALELPDLREPLLDTARAYEALAAAGSAGAYATAARETVAAEARLKASALPPAAPRRVIPPVLPLVLLGGAAAGVLVATRRRKPSAAPEPPRPRAPAWDAPPPGL
jgi:hypothetical protein